MNPLHIVLVMVEPPLPFGNAAARWFYVLLRGLVERGHRVTALATCSKPAEIEKAQGLFPSSTYNLRCYPHPKRTSLGAKWQTWRRPYAYMFHPALRRDLQRELSRRFDVLHLEQLWSGWLGLEHTQRALINIHHLQSIDLSELQPCTWRERLDHRLIFRTEHRLVQTFRFFRACSPRLVSPIQQVNQEADIQVVPVGLDTALYAYIADEQRSKVPVISLIGGMGWYPSSSAALRLLTRLWPQIKRCVPDARLQIVGWSARSVLRDYLNLPDVEIHENVPDIQPFFDRTSVMLYAPVHGSGMKIKILEAMAFGVPVVTTREGVEGLPAEDGIHASICDDDVGLVERTVALLRDAACQNRQRQAARALVEAYCSPTTTLDAIETVYAHIQKSGV